MKKILSLLLCLSPLFFSGCGSLPTPKIPPQKIETITLEKGVFIEIDKLFPLPFEGVYLQRLTSTFKGKTHEFFVHLTLTPNTFKAVAFNDIAGQLYELNWHADTLTWAPSSFIPEHFNPQYILADFLITHLPVKTLQKQLKGATVLETKNKRILQKGDIILREITYGNAVQTPLKNAHLKNPQHQYDLDIKTVGFP